MNRESETTGREVGDLLFERGRLDARQLEQVQRREARLQGTAAPRHPGAEPDFRGGCLPRAGRDPRDGVPRAERLIIEPALLGLVPVKLIFHYHMVPISLEGELLTLVFSDPPRPAELGNLRLLLGKRIQVALATPSSIRATSNDSSGWAPKPFSDSAPKSGSGDLDEEIVFDVKPADDDRR
jgi:hypothetical protein